MTERTTPIFSLCMAFVLLFFQSCSLMDPKEPGNLIPKTVDEDMSLPGLDINGTRLHLETYGTPTNRTLIFLHGGPGGDYRGLLRLRGLSDQYFLVFYDQRGSGLSRRHPADEISMSLYLRDLDAIIERYSPDAPVVLVGHSWGGMLATGYAAYQPTKVSAVVLINSGPLKASMEAYLGGGGLKPTDAWANELLWQGNLISSDDQIRADFMALQNLVAKPGFNMSKTDPMPMWRCGALAAARLVKEGMDSDQKPVYDFTKGLDRFSGAALFLVGERDEVMGPGLQKMQRSLYSHALPEVQLIAGAGHDVAWVASSEIIAEIRNFLQKH